MNNNSYLGSSLTKSLQLNINVFKELFNNDDTIVFREFESKLDTDLKCCVIFIKGMVNKDIIDEHIIQQILNLNLNELKHSEEANQDNNIDIIIKKVLVTSIVKKQTRIGALVLNNFTEFINIVGLPDSPRIYGIIPIVILSIYGVKSGVEVLGRWSEFFIVVLLVIMVATTTLAIPSMEFNRMCPVIPREIKPVLMGAVSAFSFPFAETVVFMMISSSFKNKKSSYKIYLIGLLISGLMIAYFALRNILVIGPEILSHSYFASYTALSIIRVGEFVQRIETAVTVSFLLAGFVKISICILAACNGLAKLFRFESYDVFVTPVSLTMFATSFIVYENIMEAVKFNQGVGPYYEMIFQLTLPIITYIGIKVREKSAKGKNR